MYALLQEKRKKGIEKGKSVGAVCSCVFNAGFSCLCRNIMPCFFTGVYYIFGGEIATLWMNNAAEVDVTVQSSGGSKDNILALYQGDAEIAWTQNDVMSYAYSKLNLMQQMMTLVGGLALIYQGTITDIIGIALVGGGIVWQKIQKKRELA